MQRHLDLPGLINFRDLGLYSAIDQQSRIRQVKLGSLYRSGHFNELEDVSRHVLNEKQIDLVFDFRSTKERMKKPNRLELSTKPESIEMDIDPGSGASFLRVLQQAEYKGNMNAQHMEEMMCAMNRSLVSDHAEVYRYFFQHLLVRQPKTIVIHCASGKDRTGIAVALLLSALGVDRQTIIDDYLLTNACLNVQHHVSRAMADFDPGYQSRMSEDVMSAMYGVKLHYISAAFDEIDKRYSNIQNYLQQQMALDNSAIHLLQEMYLTEY